MCLAYRHRAEQSPWPRTNSSMVEVSMLIKHVALTSAGPQTPWYSPRHSSWIISVT